MPLPSPLDDRTRLLCTSSRWKDWGGFRAVCRYESHVEGEYHALRQSAGILDLSPLVKVRVEGPQAAELLSFVTTRDLRGLRRDAVRYVALCDEAGKLVDEGTVLRLGETRFRLTAGSPVWRWVSRYAAGFDATVADESDDIATIGVQGPRSRALLEDALGAPLGLRYFRAGTRTLAGIPVEISRTGYTGDLGYEVWVPAARAGEAWDALLAAGRAHRLLPVGLDALDIARIEAGYILQGVDYYSAPTCTIESRKSSPFEAGLEESVELGRAFVGSAALERERRGSTSWALVGLELDFPAIERLFEAVGLPPALPVEASRASRPVYSHGAQVGYITSSTWSPTLKRAIALATVRRGLSALGAPVDAEFTVEHVRRTVPARVVARPFFDPPRKRA